MPVIFKLAAGSWRHRPLARTALPIVAIALCAASPGLSAQTVRYIHTDMLSSVAVVTDKDRNIVDRREYEPYGASLTGLKDGPAFAGHVQDAGTGLVYMQQRYYDPGIGNFLSIDPVGAYSSPLSAFNRYRYANSNPYRFIDPDGRVAYQAGSTITIPVYYRGAGATPAFIDAQVKAAARLVTEDGTRFRIVPLSNNMYPRGNIMDVSAGQNPNTVRGEGIVRGFNGSVAHIDSGRSDVAGATLHDTLHFVPGLSDGRQSDGYLESSDGNGGRTFTGYKPGFGEDQIMANTGGNLLKAFETSFVNDANNGNGDGQDLKKLIDDDDRKK